LPIDLPSLALDATVCAKPGSLLPETIEKDDQAWKYALFSTKAGKFLIKR
jgi:hypothetical protein